MHIMKMYLIFSFFSFVSHCKVVPINLIVIIKMNALLFDSSKCSAMSSVVVMITMDELLFPSSKCWATTSAGLGSTSSKS